MRIECHLTKTCVKAATWKLVAAGTLLMACSAGLSYNSANAQESVDGSTPKRRLALVIGEADYRGARLITGTNDASRLAVTLTGAGFVTDGGADLEQHLIREKVRTLVETAKREPDLETILVYVSSRVAQINGENVILPVGAPIDQASDVVLNGFRLNDLVNALKLVPAKARIILLDAGAPPESLKSDRNFSPGLAIVEAPDGFLISFNQDPGRALLEPQPPMGLFLKGFIDALQQPVASFADTLALTRQRVVEESGNQQKPWNVDRIRDQSLAFYPPPPGVTLPSIARKDGETVKLDSMTREDAFRKVIASDSIIDYQAFLVKFPKDEAAPTIQYNLAVRREAEIWSRALRDNTAEGYWTYISTYPDGGNVEVARQKLSLLGAQAATPVGFKAVSYADLPAPLPEIEMIASSASMPIEMMPRAPSMRLPPISAAVAAVVAAPVAAALGKRLPQVSSAVTRPSWVSSTPTPVRAPTPVNANSPARSFPSTAPVVPPGPSGSGPASRPNFQPIGQTAVQSPSPVGRPASQIAPTNPSSFRPLGQSSGNALPQNAPTAPVGAPNQGHNLQPGRIPVTPINPSSGVRPTGPVIGAPGSPGVSHAPIAAPQQTPAGRGPIAGPVQNAPRQFQQPSFAPRMQIPQAPRAAAPQVQRRPTCVTQGGKTVCR